SSSVLVIVDAQREYVDGALPLPGVAPALAVIARLIARAREADTPIVHVVHRGRSGGLFDPDGNGGRVADEAAALAGETIVGKSLPNAFAGTELDSVLKATGRQSIVLAGFMTHMCISSTARAATDLGLRVTLAADGSATRDLPDPLGGVIKADDLHRAALAALSDRFATIVAADTIPA